MATRVPLYSMPAASNEPSILAEVADGVLKLPRRLVHPREVVVAVGEVRVVRDGGVVGVERRMLVSQVLERDAEIELEQRVGSAVLQCAAIDLLRGTSVAALVQQPTPVDPCRRIVGIGFGAARVSTNRRARIGVLEAQPF